MRTSNRNRNGFTLLELMIAIGILGIGLSLVMGLFPVAMRDAHATNASQMGSIICKNGIQIAKLLLRESDTNVKNAALYYAKSNGSFAFEYPLNTMPTSSKDKTALAAGRSKYGGIVLFRKLKDSSGYQLTCISYARQDGGAISMPHHSVSAANVQVVDDVTTLINTPNLPDNSPALFTHTGKFSRITRTDTSDGDRKYLTSNINYTAADGTWVIGVAEKDNPVFSPALSTLVTITGLRP